MYTYVQMLSTDRFEFFKPKAWAAQLPTHNFLTDGVVQQ